MRSTRPSSVEPPLKRSITGHSSASIYTRMWFDITRDTICDTCQIEPSHPILVHGTIEARDTFAGSRKNRSMTLPSDARVVADFAEIGPSHWSPTLAKLMIPLVNRFRSSHSNARNSSLRIFADRGLQLHLSAAEGRPLHGARRVYSCDAR